MLLLLLASYSAPARGNVVCSDIVIRYIQPEDLTSRFVVREYFYMRHACGLQYVRHVFPEIQL